MCVSGVLLACLHVPYLLFLTWHLQLYDMPCMPIAPPDARYPQILTACRSCSIVSYLTWINDAETVKLCQLGVFCVYFLLCFLFMLWHIILVSLFWMLPTSWIASKTGLVTSPSSWHICVASAANESAKLLPLICQSSTQWGLAFLALPSLVSSRWLGIQITDIFRRFLRMLSNICKSGKNVV